MIRGTAVTVVRRTATGSDRLGNPTYAEAAEQVDGVLVSPGATADLDASRPDGVTVAYTLHFPRSYTSTLEGCSITLPAPWTGTYRVVGDPRPYMDANCPTPWHLSVEVEEAHG